MVAGIWHYSGLVINTFEAIEGEDIKHINRDISIPLATPGIQDRSCMDWLDRQEPGSVVFLSLGSLLAIDSHELTEMAWGLIESKRPFLWVVRPNLVQGSDTNELPRE
ncbi:hypothetical protein EJB05_28105, partial [Eragrostis curvula]